MKKHIHICDKQEKFLCDRVINRLQNYRFSQNQLKTVAATSMLLDYVGAELFPQIMLLLLSVNKPLL